ncbi:Spo0E family sporulation regulatory protein-aspartic acid phosphatase [Sutcliffiella sp. NPDC057660]|uniref:Spo0E family sporulation regulatory protein-aspartic acid phosphatase n=1 Tax=Sutcliffiella sp. NPDC057660 TaxID=3346199 RepID=UPI003694AA17
MITIIDYYSALENKRLELLDAVKKLGLSNERTLQISQELDELIVYVQKETKGVYKCG